MRGSGAVLVAVLAGLPLAGCLGEPLSCSEGPGSLLAKVSFLPGFGPAPTSVSRQSLSHDGLLFVYNGRETPGHGRVTVHPGATEAYLPPERVRAELEAMGRFDPGLDYAVAVAWVGDATDEEFGHLCSVLGDEWVEPKAEGDERGSCVDGGSRTYEFAASRGTVTKRAGCVGEPRTDEQDRSAQRIDAAYRALMDGVRQRAFGQRPQGTDANPYSGGE